MRQFYICTAVAAFVLCIGGSVAAQSQQQRGVDPAVARLGSGFASGMATVNGTSLYFVRGGSGPVVILLHGFPQDWYEWRKTMPLLAKTFTVVAVDLRGVGKSSEAKDGYDAANLAEDLDAAFQGNLAARAVSKRSNCKGPPGLPCAVSPQGTWLPWVPSSPSTNEWEDVRSWNTSARFRTSLEQN
jgi:hypothetical protein